MISRALSFQFVAQRRQSDASLFLFFLFVVISFSSCMHTFNNRVVVFETLSFRESAFVVERGGERRFSFW